VVVVFLHAFPVRPGPALPGPVGGRSAATPLHSCRSPVLLSSWEPRENGRSSARCSSEKELSCSLTQVIEEVFPRSAGSLVVPGRVGRRRQAFFTSDPPFCALRDAPSEPRCDRLAASPPIIFLFESGVLRITVRTGSAFPVCPLPCPPRPRIPPRGLRN